MHKLKVLTFSIILLMLLALAGPSFDVSARPLAATSPTLGAAASFSVLAALSMSAAGAGTTVSGDLGLSPGLAISRTGPWTVGGTQYFGPLSLAGTAQTDALGAFNNLAGQASDGPWIVSPWSPVPGVWTDASSPVFAGTITLNGGYDDVWVFQISTDFTFSGSVVLAGNAQACHVFWQVARDATIASGSTFVGTLIASRDVTLVSGATVNGRIISLNSSLTTDGNSITGPTCLAAPTAVPPTATATPTNTPTNTPTTSTATITPGGPTLTPTNTPTATTNTPTNTPTTSTATITPGGPTLTPTNTPTATPTSTPTPTGATATPPADTPAPTATLLPIVTSLPPTGGAPIQNEDFPWSLVIVGGFSAIALVLGVRAYRRTHLPKQ